MKKLIKFLLVSGFALLALSSFSLLKDSKIESQKASLMDIFSKPLTENTLTQGELASLVKPSTVRIARYATGTIEYPEVSLDLNKYTFTLGSKTYKQMVDNYGLGSGFIVNKDGYIVTNSHVVSKDTFVVSYEEAYLTKMLTLRMYYMTASDVRALKARVENNPKEYADFYNRLFGAVLEKTKINLEEKMVVLNPKSDDKSIKALMTEGFTATLVKENIDYWKDQKDVALIKIDQASLPSIKVVSSAGLGVGDKLYIFGFPAAADINNVVSLEPTLTQGLISSFKDSTNNDFKLIQSDAKISQGSSGGAMFNEKGEAEGVVTYLSSGGTGAAGDNFMFAVPGDLVVSLLGEQNVVNDTVGYYDSLKSGLNLLSNNHGKEAIAEFTKAKQANDNFIDPSDVDSYIEKANTLIKSGESIDSRGDEFKQWFKGTSKTVWILVIVLILVIIATVFSVRFLTGKLRKGEKAIEQIQKEMDHGPIHVETFQEPVQEVKPEVIAIEPEVKQAEVKAVVEEVVIAKMLPDDTDPRLVAYIEASRRYGKTDDKIIEALISAGWPKEVVERAFR